MNYKKNLDEMRQKYRENPIKYKYLLRPLWLNESDGLSKLYDDKNIILEYGEIYYARLVQANVILFDAKKTDDCPASIIFSTDSLVEENPEIMGDIAGAIYSFKNKPLREVPENYRELVRIIKDEYIRDSVDFYAYADEPTDILTDNKVGNTYSYNNVCRIDLRFLTTMVFRNDLPKGVITGTIFPILAAPDRCKSALILPKKYWSEELLLRW